MLPWQSSLILYWKIFCDGVHTWYLEGTMLNCECIEVQVGNWPHIFIGCHGCAEGEELTVDYGPVYWSKKANLMQQEWLSAQDAEIERLKEELLKTRKRMVFQEDQDK